MARKQPERDVTPPHNVAVERECLQSVMVSDKAAGYCFAFLDDLDFHVEFHRKLFKVLRQAFQKGVPFGTPGLLEQWLVENRFCGGDHDAADAAVVMLSNGLAIHHEHYCRVLRNLRAQRAAWIVSDKLVENARKLKPSDWLADAERQLVKFRETFKGLQETQ